MRPETVVFAVEHLIYIIPQFPSDIAVVYKKYINNIFYCSYSTRTFGAFKDSGIPGPKPWPLIGTMMDMYKHGVREDNSFIKPFYRAKLRNHNTQKPQLH